MEEATSGAVLIGPSLADALRVSQLRPALEDLGWSSARLAGRFG